MSEFNNEFKIDKDNYDFIGVFEYRNYKVPLFNDDPGQQVYCILDNNIIGFGAYNTNYEDDLKYLIDEKLDVISYFNDSSEFYGARLSYFDNCGCHDIKLTYRGRIIKIWVRDWGVPKDSHEDIIEESKKELKKYFEFMGKEEK